MPLAPQKIIFPTDIYGRHNGIIAKVVAAGQQRDVKLRIGYIPALERAGGVTEIAGMTSKIQGILSRSGITLGEEQVRSALERTIVLNPNITITGGMFNFCGRREGEEVAMSLLKPEIPGFMMEGDRTVPHQVKIEQRRLFLETIIKAVIGEMFLTERPDFNKVAEVLNIPEIFTDGRVFSGPEILPSFSEEGPVSKLGDRPNSCWSPDRKALGQGERISLERKNLTEANQRYYSEILRRFIKGNGDRPNLDAGSGWGDLTGQMPVEIQPTITHLDWNQEFLNIVQKRFPKAAVRQGNIYQMPFPEAHFGNVFSLTSFGSLWFLEQAIREVLRVLVPGGRFLYFQDMPPNEFYLAEQLFRRGMFGYGNKAFSLERLFDQKFLDNLANSLGECFEEFDSKEWDEYQQTFNQLMVMQNCLEYFEARMINELKYAGFKVLYAGPESVFSVGHRQPFCNLAALGCPRTVPTDFPFFSIGQGRGPLRQLPVLMFMEGNPFEEIRQAIGKGMLLEHSHIWAVIAEK